MPENDKVIFYVNRFIRGFGIKPPTKYFASPKLVSVTAYGLPSSELEALVGQFAIISNAREKLNLDAQTELKAANDATIKKQTAETELATLNENIVSIAQEISNENSKLETTREDSVNQQKNLTQLTPRSWRNKTL